MRRLAPLLAVIVMVAACTSDTQGTDAVDTIPSSEDLAESVTDPADTTTTTLGRLGLEQATLEFTSCLRDEGIDTPDIRLDAGGRPVLDELLEAVDTSTPEFAEALRVCASILTRAGALDLRTDPELQAVIIDQLQEFSDCMRREGIREFPDPDPAFTGTGSPYPLVEVPFDDPLFEKATFSCQEILGSLVVGD